VDHFGNLQLVQSRCMAVLGHIFNVEVWRSEGHGGPRSMQAKGQAGRPTEVDGEMLMIREILHTSMNCHMPQCQH